MSVSSLAKEMDSINSRTHTMKSKLATESMNKLASGILFKENTYEEFISFIESYDYDNNVVNSIIDYYAECVILF